MRKGDVVPDFELPDQTGTPRKLSEFLAAGPVVLFFYPAAMTYGCTKESCHFRDLGAEFAAVGRAAGGHQRRLGGQAEAVRREGVAGLPAALRCRLHRGQANSARTRSASFLPNKRMTFVIDTDRTLLDVLHSEISMSSHADKALSILKARQAA